MISLHPLFTDGCVLPVCECIIHGVTDLTGVMTVSLLDRDGQPVCSGSGRAEDGRFRCIIPAVKDAAVGLTMTVTHENGESAQVHNVARGLVFFCGGQSNMELPLCNAKGGSDEIAVHDDPLLRWYMVPKESRMDRAMEAQKQCCWQTMKPGSCADMSAVGYYFAKRVRHETGMPVGLVGCYWGGTSIAAWIREETLASCEAGKLCLDKWQKDSTPMTMDEWQAANDAFMDELNAWNDSVARCRQSDPDILWADIEAKCGPCPWHPPMGVGSPYRPGGLAETMVGMVGEFVPTAILYYQGESDNWMCDSKPYKALLETMVKEWRQRLNCPNAAFINMQLPVYADQPDESWAYIRLAQASADIPNSGIACIIDTGEQVNIHPTEKTVPGNRLAEAWLVHEELLSEEHLAPRIVKSVIADGVVQLASSLALHEPDEPVKAFEVKDAEGVWHQAQGKISGCEITLTADDIQPVGWRYAWFNWGEVNVFGENGVPLMPGCPIEG